MTCFSLTVLFFEKKSRQKKLQLSGTIYRFFRLPCVKGAVGASRLRDCFLQPSNRCAVSEPVSATPASVLRTLANPFHHFVVPLPLHMGGEFRTRLGPAFKRSHKPKKPLLRFRAGEGFFHSISQFFLSLIAACAAARRAIGTRNGEQET